MSFREKHAKFLWDFDQLDQMDQDRMDYLNYMLERRVYERSSKVRSPTQSENVFESCSMDTSIECAR